MFSWLYFTFKKPIRTVFTSGCHDDGHNIVIVKGMSGKSYEGCPCNKFAQKETELDAQGFKRVDIFKAWGYIWFNGKDIVHEDHSWGR